MAGKSLFLNPFRKKELNSVPTNGGGWFNVIKEAFTGAWQHNIEWKRNSVLAYHAIFSCITLIASDIAKLRIDLQELKGSGIWANIPLGKYKVLKKPNPYQNRIQFFETWLNSKLIRGNTYVLKARGANGTVEKLFVLNPDFCRPLVTPGGDVYYQLGEDNLNNVAIEDSELEKEGMVVVPASEIIHDRFNCFFHPLVGLSPLFASGLAAYNGLKIQENSAMHFKNMSMPSGILTAPGAISDETAQRLKEHWEANYGGSNYGKTAVLGDDLKYEKLTVSAADSQMVEQLKLNAEIVCSTFHVPPYKVIGNLPSYNNIESLEQSYYSQCLQIHIEAIELCLDEGLEVPDNQGVCFDLGGLLRMDQKTQIETLGTGITKGIFAPNEARAKVNMAPVPGGDSPYLQEQNYSLAALAKRDAKEDPFAKAATGTDTSSNSKAPVTDASSSGQAIEDNSVKFFECFMKGFELDASRETA